MKLTTPLTLIAILVASTAISASHKKSGGCTQPDLGPDIFCGTYREQPKTSFVADGGGEFTKPTKFESLSALLSSLPSDKKMRSETNFSLQKAPVTRLTVEDANVEVTAYVVAVKPGEGDHDLHVILSDQPPGGHGVYMNAEVSGRPRAGGPEDADFVRARQEIAKVVPETAGKAGTYVQITDERPVLVQGSIYFDGDHQAGCDQGCPGPSYAKPTTVWEIHPIYHIAIAGAEGMRATAVAPKASLSDLAEKPKRYCSTGARWNARLHACKWIHHRSSDLPKESQ